MEMLRNVVFTAIEQKKKASKNFSKEERVKGGLRIAFAAIWLGNSRMCL